MSCSACGTLCQRWGARQRGHTLAVLPKRASASVQPLESGSRAAGLLWKHQQEQDAASSPALHTVCLIPCRQCSLHELPSTDSARHSSVEVTWCLVQLCSPTANRPSINKNDSSSYHMVRRVPPVLQEMHVPSGSSHATSLTNIYVTSYKIK